MSRTYSAIALNRSLRDIACRSFATNLTNLKEIDDVLLPLLTGEGRAHHAEVLHQATQLAKANQLRPVVDPRHFTLDTALSAHEAMEQGTAVSKIVSDL